MANTALTQHALAKDEQFLRRLQAALTTVAWQVLMELSTVPNHAARKAYAAKVIANPVGVAVMLAPSFVMRTNVFAFATSYDFDRGAVVTASGDLDLQSQLITDWDVLSGV